MSRITIPCCTTPCSSVIGGGIDSPSLTYGGKCWVSIRNFVKIICCSGRSIIPWRSIIRGGTDSPCFSNCNKSIITKCNPIQMIIFCSSSSSFRYRSGFQRSFHFVFVSGEIRTWRKDKYKDNWKEQSVFH